MDIETKEILDAIWAECDASEIDIDNHWMFSIMVGQTGLPYQEIVDYFCETIEDKLS